MVKTAACSVDVCGGCKGLWLDASELAALRRARPNVVGAVAVGAAAAVATAAVVSSMSGPGPVAQSSQYNTLKIAGEVVEEGLELAVGGDTETLSAVVDVGGAVVDAGGGMLEFVSSGLDTGLEALVGLIGALFD
jgi:Zn-finger nucleic acid-binding protein